MNTTEIPGLSYVLTPEGRLTAQEWTPEKGHGFVSRDALTAARLLHPWRPEIAAAVVRWAAQWQGTKRTPVWDEAPGRIPHEVVEPGQWREPTYLELPVRPGERIVYYGSADATAEWLITLGLVASADPAVADELQEHWTAAGAHLLHELAIGGGLVRWGVQAWPGTGLEAQSWRDERNMRHPVGGSLLHPDGRPPAAPVADWDTQASALVGLRALARLSGDPDHRRAARGLEALLHTIYAPNTLGVDAHNTYIDGAGSSPGVLLWAGALSQVKADQAARRLLAGDDLCTPYGIRTVATTEQQYSPVATRRGRIYAYNSYLAVCGLRSAGRVEEADRLAAGMIEAIDRLGDYPESWVFDDSRELQRTGPSRSAWTIAVRHALEHRHFDTVAGLCEPSLR